jgi:PAS domain S-box-containing protein
MKNQANRGAEATDSSGKALRQRAEEIARGKESRLSENNEAVTPEETRKNIHELFVHQIELEMQNDELRRAQAELEEARARYLDLYDMAPVGYCTISEKGLILEINLTAAGMLGVARGSLINMPLSKFIYKEDQDIYYLHRRLIFEAGEPKAYDLRMTKRDGTVFWAHLDAICLDKDGIPVCRVALSDITGRKHAEEALFEKTKQLEEANRQKIDIIESISDCFYTLDRDLRFTYVNKAAEEIWGIPRADLTGRKIEDVFPG